MEQPQLKRTVGANSSGTESRRKFIKTVNDKRRSPELTKAWEDQKQIYHSYMNTAQSVSNIAREYGVLDRAIYRIIEKVKQSQ